MCVYVCLLCDVFMCSNRPMSGVSARPSGGTPEVRLDRRCVPVETEEGESSDIPQTLQVLADGITNIQASLVKPKEKKPKSEGH